MRQADTRSPRVSEHLTAHQCSQALETAEAANAAGAPLTCFVTVNWELAGIPPHACQEANTGLTKDMQEWVIRHGGAGYWISVQEYAESVGCHVHILLHVPELAFQMFSKWLRQRITHWLGKGYITDHLHIRRLPSSTDKPDDHAAVGRQKLHYMLKCAPTEIEAGLGLEGWGDAEWGQKGLVHGRRLSRAQVGRAPRRSRGEALAPRPPVNPAKARRCAAMLLARRQPVLPPIPHCGFPKQLPALRRGWRELRIMPRLAKPWRQVAPFPCLSGNPPPAGWPISEAKAQGP